MRSSIVSLIILAVATRCSAQNTARIIVSSATTKAAIPNANCVIDGTYSGTSGSNGEISSLNVGATPLSAASMTCTASYFANYQRTVTVSGSAYYEVYMSPSDQVATGNGDTFRIVLEWDDDPRDLDAHFGSSNPSLHVYYSDKVWTSGSARVELDAESTNGHGPETITISNLPLGIFHYYVHKYAGTQDLGHSNAQLSVYFDNSAVAAATLTVPTTTSDQYWHAFSLKHSSSNGCFETTFYRRDALVSSQPVFSMDPDSSYPSTAELWHSSCSGYGTGIAFTPAVAAPSASAALSATASSSSDGSMFNKTDHGEGGGTAVILVVVLVAFAIIFACAAFRVRQNARKRKRAIRAANNGPRMEKGRVKAQGS